MVIRCVAFVYHLFLDINITKWRYIVWRMNTIV